MRFGVLLFLLSLVVPVGSQEAGNPWYSIQSERDVVYRVVDGKELNLNISYPVQKNDQEQFPAVIYIYHSWGETHGLYPPKDEGNI